MPDLKTGGHLHRTPQRVHSLYKRYRGVNLTSKGKCKVVTDRSCSHRVYPGLDWSPTGLAVGSGLVSRPAPAMGLHRRLSKDYASWPETSAAWNYVALIDRKLENLSSSIGIGSVHHLIVQALNFGSCWSSSPTPFDMNQDQYFVTVKYGKTQVLFIQPQT